jgi:hypothetical protein
VLAGGRTTLTPVRSDNKRFLAERTVVPAAEDQSVSGGRPSGVSYIAVTLR